MHIPTTTYRSSEHLRLLLSLDRSVEPNDELSEKAVTEPQSASSARFTEERWAVQALIHQLKAPNNGLVSLYRRENPGLPLPSCTDRHSVYEFLTMRHILSENECDIIYICLSAPVPFST
jgi:hypothetical protein